MGNSGLEKHAGSSMKAESPKVQLDGCFGPSERASEAIFSIALFPRWVSLFFLQSGAKLPDPQKLLKGSGKRVRHIVLEGAATLDKPAVQALIAHALERAAKPLDATNRRRTVIKFISAKQRPRRPA